MARFRYYIVALICCALMACEADVEQYESFRNSTTFTISPASSVATTDGVNSLRAYIFDKGKLRDILRDITIANSGEVLIDLAYSYDSEIYLLGNATDAMASALEAEFTMGKTTTSELCEMLVLESYDQPSNSNKPLFVGYEMATELSGGNIVHLDRAFAFIDIDIEEQNDGGVEIRKIEFVGAATAIAPFSSSNVIEPSDSYSYSISYSTPITTSTQSLYYINQGYYTTAVSIVIDAIIDGSPSQIIRYLPNEIDSKNRYVVRILSNGAGGVTIEPFEEEDDEVDVESTLPSYISVSASGSTLPNDVTLSSDCATVYMPFHRDVDMTLQLICRDGDTSALSFGTMSNSDFTITALGANRFQVSMKKAYINAMTEYWNIPILANGSQVGSIAFERDGHPIRFAGRFLNYLTDDETFEADTFIDADMLEVSIIAGDYSFELNGDWVRFEPAALSEGRYVVQGGWKPNDREARGEKQIASLWVLNGDGERVLEYPMSRLNYSLPVVKVYGIWWCKFPMRGNRTRFEDQIQSHDSRADMDIYEFLKTCSSEEFHDIFGAIYKGLELEPLDITKGEIVSDDDGSISYAWQITDGDGSVTHIGTTDGSSTSPGGYYLPTTDDILTHLFTGTWNVSGGVIPENADIPTLGGYNRNDRRYRFRPYYRTNMYHEGLQYPTGWMEIADVGVTGSNVNGAVVEGPLVWVGAGYATANGPGYFNTLSQRYALSSVVTPMYINVSGSNFILSYTSAGGSFIPYTHRAIKIPNDFILD